MEGEYEEDYGSEEPISPRLVQAILEQFLPPLSLTLASSDNAPISLKRKVPLSFDDDENYLQLSTGEEFYFTKNDDGKRNVITPEWIEPNQYVRKLLGRIPTPLQDRLRFLAKFQKETEIVYDNAENVRFENLRNQLQRAYLIERRLRFQMRRFLQRWRINRMDRLYEPIEDPITLSLPEKVVSVYAVKKYEFDAKSLSTHIESQLMYHEDGFSMPMNPRNPWTNVEFTYSQLFSICVQLHHHTELKWAFQTLRQYNFDINKWKLYHSNTLTVKGIYQCIQRLDSNHSRELLEDFIFAKLEELDIPITSHMTHAYRQALKHLSTHWYIEKWKKLAYIHYEAHYFNRNMTHIILDRCEDLIEKQYLLYSELRKRNLIA